MDISGRLDLRPSFSISKVLKKSQNPLKMKQEPWKFRKQKRVVYNSRENTAFITKIQNTKLTKSLVYKNENFTLAFCLEFV
jgi:hypothetical protein